MLLWVLLAAGDAPVVRGKVGRLLRTCYSRGPCVAAVRSAKLGTLVWCRPRMVSACVDVQKEVEGKHQLEEQVGKTNPRTGLPPTRWAVGPDTPPARAMEG